MSAANRLSASSPAGSIYDLGYRHYEGRRHGRWYAAWSLYVESLRGIWGFGRPMSAKAAPFILAGLYAFPAAIQLAFASVIAQSIKEGNTASLLTYGDYFTGFGFLIILFCVAQAPEVVCRDQRYQVLPLYFTRAMVRTDYALARLASLATALFIALMVPMIALFVGDVLMGADAFAAIGGELPKALPAIPANLLVAVSMASISLALSSYSPRRAYSAIGLVAYFLLMEAVPAIIYSLGQQAGWTWADKLVLAAPVTSLEAAMDWFFGRSLGARGYPSTLGPEAYVLACLASIVLFTAILLFRYRRIAA
jgi:ABC-2 type transport system permease protein